MNKSTNKISIETFMSLRKYNPYKIISTVQNQRQTQVQTQGQKQNMYIINKCKLHGILNIEINSHKKKAVLELKENSWSNKLKDSDQENSKIISLLNKINDSNYTKLLGDIRKEKFSELKLIEFIFNKANKEPGYINLYIKLCTDLKLCESINNKCVEQFKTKKHVNLVKFMCEMFRKNLIVDIKKFIYVLIEEISDINIELLILFNLELGQQTQNQGQATHVQNQGQKVNKKQNQGQVTQGQITQGQKSSLYNKINISDIIKDLKTKLENDDTLINSLKPRNKFMLGDLLKKFD